MDIGNDSHFPGDGHLYYDKPLTVPISGVFVHSFYSQDLDIILVGIQRGLVVMTSAVQSDVKTISSVVLPMLMCKCLDYTRMLFT